ncbi:tol-pal system protein YbgF [Rhodoligotrophos appendicifer]|uniref:tol-pal system protein YbgF n=1 Tax=Rhodoligotrophos appendicifer TaxID=987056 RepID=UPI0011853DB6|nr:tol-pal system protein YbgF [Rhodoligotrophos appendicifer]
MTARHLGVRGPIFAAVIAAAWLLPGAAAQAQSYDPSTAAQLGMQMNQLQEQMRQLVGQMQETGYRLQTLEEQMRRLQDDSNYRLQQLEQGKGRSGSRSETGNSRVASIQGGGAAGQSLSQAVPSYGAEGGLEQLASSVVQDPSLDPSRAYAAPGSNGAARGASGPQVLGTIPADATEAGASGTAGGGPVSLTTGLQKSYGTVQGNYGSAAPAYNGQDGASASLVPETVESSELNDNGLAPPIAAAPAQQGTGGSAGGTAVAALTTSGGGPDQLYETAYASYAGKDYAAAEQGFRTFLTQYGKNPLAGNAQYWLGETYYAQGDFKQAAGEFLKGYQSYKKGRKAPDSLLKLAMTLNKLGQKEQACAAFDQVSRAFPSSKDAIRRATQESKKAGCA